MFPFLIHLRNLNYEKLSPDEVLVSKEKLKYQNFATGSGHILISFIIGIGAG